MWLWRERDQQHEGMGKPRAPSLEGALTSVSGDRGERDGVARACDRSQRQTEPETERPAPVSWAWRLPPAADQLACWKYRSSSLVRCSRLLYFRRLDTKRRLNTKVMRTRKMQKQDRLLFWQPRRQIGGEILTFEDLRKRFSLSREEQGKQLELRPLARALVVGRDQTDSQRPATSMETDYVLRDSSGETPIVAVKSILEAAVELQLRVLILLQRLEASEEPEAPEAAESRNGSARVRRASKPSTPKPQAIGENTPSSGAYDFVKGPSTYRATGGNGNPFGLSAEGLAKADALADLFIEADGANSSNNNDDDDDDGVDDLELLDGTHDFDNLFGDKSSDDDDDINSNNTTTTTTAVSTTWGFPDGTFDFSDWYDFGDSLGDNNNNNNNNDDDDDGSNNNNNHNTGDGIDDLEFVDGTDDFDDFLGDVE